jgi:predicted metal-dependent HD superfamily phosphohydrolase
MLDREWAQLFNNYSDPARAYHNWSHIGSMMALYDEVHERLERPRAVMLAILFHDAVYDPLRGDNEALSAEFMHHTVHDEHPDDLIGASVLIHFTQQHEIDARFAPDIRNDASYFLDMDLHILGSHPLKFRKFCDDIRKEYHAIDEATYVPARRGVLQKFLDRPQLFLSPWGHRRWEQQARVNLAAEVSRLGA